MPSLRDLCRHLRLPVIAAPMTGVSSRQLVIAACRSGVIGSFPTHNAPPGQLGDWMAEIHRHLEGDDAVAPFATNLVVHRSNKRMQEDLAELLRLPPALAITSVGSPADVVQRLHDVGTLVLADVATLHHGERAVDAGVDGLVLLTAGAGGQTGWANPFAFVRAMRDRVGDLPLVLAGGVSDGHALWAARVLGCELAFMGTRFIATSESGAPDAYRQMLLRASIDDIVLTTEISGLPASFLEESLRKHVAQPAPGGPEFTFDLDLIEDSSGPYSAGHSVGAVTEILSVDALVEQTRRQYEAAQEQTLALLTPEPVRQ